jgi:hypothetical protein
MVSFDIGALTAAGALSPRSHSASYPRDATPSWQQLRRVPITSDQLVACSPRLSLPAMGHDSSVYGGMRGRLLPACRQQPTSKFCSSLPLVSPHRGHAESSQLGINVRFSSEALDKRLHALVHVPWSLRTAASPWIELRREPADPHVAMLHGVTPVVANCRLTNGDSHEDAAGAPGEAACGSAVSPRQPLRAPPVGGALPHHCSLLMSSQATPSSSHCAAAILTPAKGNS